MATSTISARIVALVPQRPLNLLVKLLLKLHNWSYQRAGSLASRLEAGRLHPKHRLMDYHHWFASQLQKDWSVLDVGCGVGALAEALVPHCQELTGIDLDAIKLSKAIVRVPSGKFIAGDVTKIKFEKKFDALVLSNVLEHIDDRITFLRNIRDIAPMFLIRVPLIDRDWITLYKKETGVEWRLDPTHFTEYTFESFQKELRAAGLLIAESRIRYGEIYAVVTRTDRDS